MDWTNMAHHDTETRGWTGERQESVHWWMLESTTTDASPANGAEPIAYDDGTLQDLAKMSAVWPDQLVPMAIDLFEQLEEVHERGQQLHGINARSILLGRDEDGCLRAHFRTVPCVDSPPSRNYTPRTDVSQLAETLSRALDGWGIGRAPHPYDHYFPGAEPLLALLDRCMHTQPGRRPRAGQARIQLIQWQGRYRQAFQRWANSEVDSPDTAAGV